jgi:hypothetical protein
VPANRVRQQIHAGLLTVTARDARGHALLKPDARPRYKAPTEVVSCMHGGLLAIAGGYCSIRRATLAERAKHRGDSSCGCELHAALHRSAKADAAAKREARFERVLAELEGRDED